VNVPGPQPQSERSAQAADLPSAAVLDRSLRDASPAEIIAAALAAIGREHLAVVSSFGTESAALLKVTAEVDPAIPVIFLDTGWLFEETLAYRDTLIGLDRTARRDVVAPGPCARTMVDRSRRVLPYPQG
jgi:phosphoadenosine phosphosulfate reductase